MTNQYDRPEQFYPTREQERKWEGEAQAKADEYQNNRQVEADAVKKQPREIWAEMKATEYSPKAIKNVISFESDDVLDDIANQLKAMNMIAYNQMVDSRIDRAQRSWGMK